MHQICAILTQSSGMQQPLLPEALVYSAIKCFFTDYLMKKEGCKVIVVECMTDNFPCLLRSGGQDVIVVRILFS